MLPGAEFMNSFDQRNHILDRSLGQNPMSQVENVARPSCGLLKNLLRLRPDVIFACKQCHRIEVSHYPDIVSETLPGLIQADAPVEPNYVAAGFTHQFE